MTNSARMQPVCGEWGRIGKPVSLTPKTLPEVTRRHELLSVRPLALQPRFPHLSKSQYLVPWAVLVPLKSNWNVRCAWQGISL